MTRYIGTVLRTYTMNFADAPTIRNPREFLAVILAGFGAEYVLLTTPNFLLILCKITATDEQLW